MSSASLLLLSNALFFVFSLLGVLASVAIFFLARATERQADREWEAYKVQASTEMSRSRVEVERAKATAASELADAALANQKSAHLELALERERAALDATTTSPADHHHAPAKKPVARNIARPINISLPVGMVDTGIAIVSEEGDAESARLASAIRALFDGSAQVSVAHVAGSGADDPVRMAGVHIVRSENAEAQRIAKTLSDVLSKNKIQCELIGDQDHAGRHAASQRPQSASFVTVYVGPRPER